MRCIWWSLQRSDIVREQRLLELSLGFLREAYVHGRMDALAHLDARRDRDRNNHSTAVSYTRYARIERLRHPLFTDTVDGNARALLLSVNPSSRAGTLFERGIARIRA
jgi:hypothetical protein